MTDTYPPSPKDPAPGDVTEEARARRAARRRWLTLAEILALTGVTISALTLWNNWSERSEKDADKAAEAHRASTRAVTLVLTGQPAGEHGLTLRPASPDQSVQSQIIRFPSALGVAPVSTTGEPRIEAGWFADALKRAREKAGMPDDSRGDEQLPVAITTRFLIDGQQHEDVALYDIGYTISGRLLGGHNLTLRGVSLASRVGAEIGRAHV